jgi:cytochrome c biogenesis protein ResB
MLLRRRRYHVRTAYPGGDADESVLVAEKGLAHDAGSLLFPVPFPKGHPHEDHEDRPVAIIAEAHTGIKVRLREFTVRYRRDTSPAEFLSQVELTSADRTERESVDLRVNHPAKFGGVTLYQSAYGWAPMLRVTKTRPPAPP